MTAISNALSGLNAYSTRLGVSANNVANAQSPDYQKQEVVQTSQAGGGVEVSVQNAPVINSANYSGDSADATSQGFVNPDIDYAQEAVEQRLDVAGYKANAAVIRTLSALDKDLLNIQA